MKIAGLMKGRKARRPEMVFGSGSRCRYRLYLLTLAEAATGRTEAGTDPGFDLVFLAGLDATGRVPSLLRRL